MAASGQNNERHRGNVPRGSRAVAHRALRDGARLLVHRSPHRPRWALRNTANGLLLYDGLYVGACNPLQSLARAHHTVFVVMYSLTFFFANFGPNITTFIVPAEIFPARLRSTCHGEPLSELSGSSTRHKAGMQMKQRKDIQQVEASSRHHVFIGNCYSASPSTIINRFPKVKALTLKGKPRFVDFNLVPKNWGAHLHPWVLSMASAYPWLETLSLNKMTIIDDNLAILANSFPNFKELVLFYCEGFNTGALAMIARKC
ncbi:hypothetical protein KI387_013214, partial [Taxus chinensis]